MRRFLIWKYESDANMQVDSCKPAWLKVRVTSKSIIDQVKKQIDRFSLNTVCEEAHCPNLSPCWSNRAVTILLLGKTCTRSCCFCATRSGNPGGKTDRDEPQRVAEFVRASGSNYIVLTSVARDDLPDGGAGIISETIGRIKEESVTRIEVLIPDFRASVHALGKIIGSQPEVTGHDIETVERLSRTVRGSERSHKMSLTVLETLKLLNPRVITKSGLMVGLGETKEDIQLAMKRLVSVGVDILTIGQYLSPSEKHLPVSRYLSLEEFKDLETEGYKVGFGVVLAGPLVRSSFRAEEAWKRLDNYSCRNTLR